MKQMERRQAETMGWPILEPIEAEGVTRAVALSQQVCVAGAREHVNLRLPSKRVSRTHALFVADRDAIYLRDLASRNHTFLNEEKIREAVLRNGDVIGLGPLTFRCQSGFDRPDGQDGAQAPPAELRMESDDARFPLSGRTSVIGSRGDCDVLLRGDDVDPAHAVIYQREGRRFIRDLRSQSNTLVNDEPVKEAELQPGDRIQIGGAHLIYQTVASEQDAGIPFELDQHEPQPAGESERDSENDLEVALPADEMAAVEPPDELPLSMDEFDVPQSFDTAETAEEAPAESLLEAHEELDDSIPLAPSTPDEDEVPLDSAPAESRLDDSSVDASGGGAARLPSGFETVPEPEQPDAELEPAAPIVAPIPTAELEQLSGINQALSEPIPAEPPPSAPQREGRAGGEEKMTELLGELVETVAKVQSTWEEIKGESQEHADRSESREHVSH
jgi:pSer/pThr/pTyr-binding forkhead associated (FHA) protein